MRNLWYYPITAEEVFLTIDQIPFNEKACGDIRGTIKHELTNYFKNEERMAELLEQMRIKI